MQKETLALLIKEVEAEVKEQLDFFKYVVGLVPFTDYLETVMKESEKTEKPLSREEGVKDWWGEN